MNELVRIRSRLGDGFGYLLRIIAILGLYINKFPDEYRFGNLARVKVQGYGQSVDLGPAVGK